MVLGRLHPERQIYQNRVMLLSDLICFFAPYRKEHSMNSKYPAYLMLCLGVFFFSSSIHAEDSGIPYGAQIAGKFGIGLINATTGIVEIPKTMMAVSEADGLAKGLSLGLFQGMGNMLGRTFLGMLDVISFPIPTKPLINPPVVFEDFGVETSYGSGWETY